VSCSTMMQAESIVAQPLTVIIHKIENRAKSTRIGRHTRKTKGKTYTSPRILLRPSMDEYVGARALIFRARASLIGGGWNLPDQVILIAVLLPK
jgi:hypothetical protein